MVVPALVQVRFARLVIQAQLLDQFLPRHPPFQDAMELLGVDIERRFFGGTARDSLWGWLLVVILLRRYGGVVVCRWLVLVLRLLRWGCVRRRVWGLRGRRDGGARLLRGVVHEWLLRGCHSGAGHGRRVAHLPLRHLLVLRRHRDLRGYWLLVHAHVPACRVTLTGRAGGRLPLRFDLDACDTW